MRILSCIAHIALANVGHVSELSPSTTGLTLDPALYYESSLETFADLFAQPTKELVGNAPAQAALPAAQHHCNTRQGTPIGELRATVAAFKFLPHFVT